eukprot:TRINITY_DN4283_c0_g1_i1.p1 TRINITY_DN4283_c0_g1~~TRINITY_DN4283_c0_g1_i1.p1  ORF type:complete len:268 (+),score=40.20 TRINITY_DN4283_c0_g1_i1:71-874(+)
MTEGKEVCSFWVSGNCRYGDQCNKAHPPEVKGVRTPFNPGFSTNGLWVPFYTSNGVYVPTVESSNEYNPITQYEPQECKYWQKGHCMFDRCRFKHSNPKIPPHHPVLPQGDYQKNIQNIQNKASVPIKLSESEKENQGPYFGRLIDSLILDIFMFCVDFGSANIKSYVTIHKVAEVCQAWNRISRDDALWNKICTNYFFFPNAKNIIPKKPTESWRQYFYVMTSFEKDEFDEDVDDFEEENERIESGPFYDDYDYEYDYNDHLYPGY